MHQRNEHFLLFCRHAEQRRQRSQMLALTACYVRRKIFERGCHEEFGSMLRPYFSIIRAAGCPETNPESLTPKGSIRRRHEYLWGDVFLTFKV